MIVPLAALFLFLYMDGSMPNFAHLNTAHTEYLLRGMWMNWQTQMRMWHPQELALWGGMLLSTGATLRTLIRAK
jgi:hypothetical protein